MTGCDDGRDQRLANVAMESAARQAEQNQRMGESQPQVAQGITQLVDSDTQARQKLAELQRELRTE